MVSNYLKTSDMYGICCFTVFSLHAIIEMIYYILSYIFMIEKCESPEIFFINNLNNIRVINSCPSLKSFKIAYWCRGGRAQTLVQSLKQKPKKSYERELLMLSDGVEVALDWKYTSNMNDNTSIILCLHGLGGDSNSRYIQTFTQTCVEKGYRVVVYNRRGHGMVSLIPKKKTNIKPKIFPRHCNLDDMNEVVNHIVKKYKNSDKYMIGFSCGANLLVKYLSQDIDIPFKASASISNGYQIYRGTSLLKQNDRICDGIVTQFLKDILKQGRINDVAVLASEYNIELDIKGIMNSKSLHTLEELLIVKAYGYTSLEEYYNADSCHMTIKNVNSPLLCIANKDDPLVHKDMIETPILAAEHNPNIITVVTERGGHVGWIEGFTKEPWYSKVFFEYIASI
jgi:predicted alpha/beta-fold hydrolase